jgi:TonB family protein
MHTRNKAGRGGERSSSPEELKSAMSPTAATAAIRGPAPGPAGPGCGTANFGDRMLAMASYCATDRDARRNGLQRLVVAFAGCCSFHLAFAQTEPLPGPTVAVPTTTAPEPAVEGGDNDADLVTQSDPKAIVAANERLVQSTEQEFGKNTRQSAEAYADLAAAQRRAGDHEAAEKSYLTVVEIYRAIDGPFSPRVIPALTDLGDNYHESGNFAEAVTAYREARTVNRRAFGLLNADQIPLLDRMTKSFVELNQPVEADQQQLEAMRLIERSHPPQSDEALGAIYKYAAWLRESGRHQDERDQYARALRTIRDTLGKEDVRQVRPLVGIGNSFRIQRIPEGQGVGALRDALALLMAHKDSDQLAIAEVLRDLGDWEVAFTKVEYDGAEYRRAWQLLGDVPNGARLRDEWFTGPHFVLREPISLRGLSQDADAPEGHVLVKFDIDKAGHSANAAVVESDPPGLKDEAVLRHVRRSRFRPQMVNGEVVPRAALALQYNYRYTPDALTADEDGTSRRD